MTIEQQLQASVDLAACVVPREKLPTEAELTAVHAMLSRVCRERSMRIRVTLTP